ncbi:PEP-CTERM/exosortase system-associated acyltransferase [Nitrosomonas sp.]|uniref:PEP-CTERM/exosortase system-associated acyltransferase n=1 Tax=Nitrosomonas sp. TaxID=42353 RepID=UPI0025D9982F|nr:PEP-CTERM/exosortase system-associated acyltransferase [Nitrosomonas sp.]MCC6915767.1 PEP-CTERM/exosortase system-associated acyltransferase [Nitrosomonas sp.]
MNDIEAAFHQYFEIVNADTPELLKTVFDLRYRILCVHNTFPDFGGSKFPDGLEKDEYDRRSVHILLRHKPTGTYIGTTRLILPNQKDLTDKFPTEHNTRFYPDFALDPAIRKHTAEISRFAILSDFFKRKDEHGILSQSDEVRSEMQDRRRFPHPMLALVVGIAQLCARHNIYHLISSMEPALNRLLGFYGLQLNPIGPSADYHGIRTPCYVYLLDVLDRMYQEHRLIWELVTDHGKIWPMNLACIHKKTLKLTCTNNIGIPG